MTPATANPSDLLPSSGVLLTTCHLMHDGTADLLRLIASAEAALRDGEIKNLRHIILLQGCSRSQCNEISRGLPNWVELLSTTRSVSSPAARNLMIHHLLATDGIDPDAFVAFPDDDAWYPSGALACVTGHFQSPADIQLLLCRYGPFPSADGCRQAVRGTLQQALSSGACATIFVRGSLLANLGGFHELLGLGTELRGGEDTEFVHRAFHRSSGKLLCVPGVLVGHAAPEPAKKANYYEGGLAALMAHSHVSAAARVALIRKLAVGVALVLRKRMTLSQYVEALRRARASADAVRVGPTSSQMEWRTMIE